MNWHRLSSIHRGDELTELLAASCDDGIGVIARWTLRADGGWDVEAMDTEGGGMQAVTDFSEGEPVPPSPPTLFDDAPVPADPAGRAVLLWEIAVTHPRSGEVLKVKAQGRTGKEALADASEVLAATFRPSSDGRVLKHVGLGIPATVAVTLADGRVRCRKLESFELGIAYMAGELASLPECAIPGRLLGSDAKKFQLIAMGGAAT